MMLAKNSTVPVGILVNPISRATFGVTAITKNLRISHFEAYPSALNI